MSKKLMTAIAAATLGAVSLSAPVNAEISVTAGFVSDYVYRGAGLGDAGANASIDYAHDSGFYAGIWGIDDGYGANDGLEFDIYAGYGQETDSFAWSIGYTRYNYTYASSFEHEVNLGFSAGAFGLAVDIGEADPNDGSDTSDYNHFSLSWTVNDVYGLTIGQVDPDTDADDDEWLYFEVSASGEISGLDVSMSLGKVEQGDALGDGIGGYMVLSVSKTFEGLGF